LAGRRATRTAAARVKVAKQASQGSTVKKCEKRILSGAHAMSKAARNAGQAPATDQASMKVASTVKASTTPVMLRPNTMDAS
jgi:hypothetical protein